MGALFDNLFCRKKIELKNELVRDSLDCDCREAENWSGYLSESSQSHSEKSRLDFLSLRGKNKLETNFKEKKNLWICNLRTSPA